MSVHYTSTHFCFKNDEDIQVATIIQYLNEDDSCHNMWYVYHSCPKALVYGFCACKDKYLHKDGIWRAGTRNDDTEEWSGFYSSFIEAFNMLVGI